MSTTRIGTGASKALAATLLASAAAAQAQPLDTASATALVAPFYEALTASSADAVAPLLEQSTSPGWMNCSGDDACQSREQTRQRWTARLAVVPDMKWARKEILVAGSRVVVRGEVSGVPVAAFLAQAPRGRAFRVMTIDVHEVADGRIVRTWHLEDWMGAQRQLSGPGGAK